MRIGFDARCLMEGSRTGVEEYTIGFLKRILEQDSQNRYVLFFNSFKKIEEDLSWLKKYKNVEIKNYGFPNKFLNFSMWFFGWPRIDVLLGGIDVFFAPNISFISLSKKCRLVMTVHDLSFERFPEHFSKKRRLWHFLLNPRSLCKRANKILAVSVSTKNDLKQIYGIAHKKIDVLSPFVDFESFIGNKENTTRIRTVKARYHLPDKFLLYLGTIEPRKNIISIIKAFESLKERGNVDPDLKLVIAGSLGWSYDRIIETINKSSQKENIIQTGFVDDKDKPFVYACCKLFIYPSFFEGYGFPPAEAMAAGIPVITSNCSSIPEVVDDSGILIDPYRPFDIVIAVELLLNDKELYNEYVKRGTQRAKLLANQNKNKNCLDKLIISK